MRSGTIVQRIALIAIVLNLLRASIAVGQFSPGKLSKAHEQLEGMQHCADCHEVGKEIKGQKCLRCHTEIKTGLETNQGYHAAVSSKNCVTCHKEHLGRDAETVLFDKRTFDHSVTGFQRTGKHASVRCEDCHAGKNIKKPEILKIVSQSGRATYLGLSTACVACHEDKHRGTEGAECQSCHTTSAWSPASLFDHAKAKFILLGKHTTVQCNKCHNVDPQSNKDRVLILPTRSYQDCTPCHRSPHGEKFVNRTCSTCHSPEDWRVLKKKEFDHDGLTLFKLVGKHAALQCQECHKGTSKQSFVTAFKMAHSRCIDCHTDYHKGEFSKKYADDCLKCHTQDTFRLTTFSIAAHAQTRFALNGGHIAIPCAKCHNAAADGHASFRFANLQCSSCHKDKHAGQFAGVGGETDCAKCHTSDDWKAQRFDHSRSRLVLTGKHLGTTCDKCHKPTRIKGQETVQYLGLKMECESCHKEIHAGQFTMNGTTKCAGCHTPQSWTQLAFDHNMQSTFSLTGAHRKVACRACHREENAGGARFVRFKPLSSKCETCHH